MMTLGDLADVYGGPVQITEQLYTIDKDGYYNFTGNEISLNCYGTKGFTTLSCIPKNSVLFQKEVLDIFNSYGGVLSVHIRTIVNQ